MSTANGGEPHSDANTPSVLIMWGSGCSRQLGTKEQKVAPPSLVSLPSSARCKQVACGGRHCAVLLDSGRICLFGRNKEGQCADGDDEESSVRKTCVQPSILRLAMPVSFVACGSGHTVAIAGGQLWEWGLLLPQQRGDLQGMSLREGYSLMGGAHDNEHAQRLAEESWYAYLQTTETVQEHRYITKSPRLAEGLPQGLETAACGWAHTIVLTDDGRVFAAGYSDKGQLGTGTRINSGTYVKSSIELCAVAVSAGLNHSLVATKCGRVFSWGHGALGQLGLGLKKEAKVPSCVDLPSQVRIVGVAAGDGHSLAVSECGNVYGWGHTEYFQLGRTHESDGQVHWVLPKQLKGFEDIQYVRAGGSFSLSYGNSKLASWGWNTKKQLGQGTFGYSVHPMPVNFTFLPAHENLKFNSLDCGTEFAACIVEPGPAARHLHVWGPRNQRLAAHQNTCTDVTIRSDQGDVACHACMLNVRCPKLASLCTNGEIDLRGNSKASIAALVDYVYRDHAPNDACDRAELAALAQRFQLSRLCSMLEWRGAARAHIEGEGQYVKRNGKWVLVSEEKLPTLGQSGNDAMVSTFYEDLQSVQEAGGLLIYLQSATETAHVRAWRSLMCEIEYFRALLDSSFLEAAQSEVTINVDSVEAAITAIRFVHTGDRRQQSYPQVDPSEVASIADLFGIDDLVDAADMWAMHT